MTTNVEATMPDPTPDDLARQARHHLDSLRAAGVDWLPTAPPPRRRSASSAAAADSGPSLFQSGAGEPAAPAPLPAEERRRELTVLAERVSTCPRCPELVATRTQTVFGVG